MNDPFELLFNLYQYLADYFSTPEVQRTLLWLKIFSMSISLLLIVSIIILLSRAKATWWISERLDSFRKPNLPQYYEKRWQKIQDRLEAADEANLKLAIIEADSLLDDILKRMGLAGKDMGERLEQITVQQLSSINDIWEAHRLRNIIVHQSGIRITQTEAKKAIESYEKALKELEVL